MEKPAGRRPLKSRQRPWASSLSRALLRLGLSPNQVSVLSAVFAGGAAAAMGMSGQGGTLPAWLWWLLAAVGIQLRLICNLMDGLMAVEGGRRTADGDIYNEFPDRIADVLVLAGLGLASGTRVGEMLGWACACGALVTACIRMHGASLTGSHDFCGPFAKPHRMALSTAACLAMAVAGRWISAGDLLPWVLGVMAVGIAVTVVRRLRRLSRALLHGKSS